MDIVGNFIDHRLQITVIPNKGRGIIAKEKIPKNTIIMKEVPSIILPSDEIIFSDMFQLLYIIACSRPEIKHQFYLLQPNKIDQFVCHRKRMVQSFEKLSTIQNRHAKRIYTYFKRNFTIDELLLMAAKYMCNAFDFGIGGPVILFTGTLLNHSCDPNVSF